ncbi:flagellar hook-length control protein FliK [Salinisphaera aquimarina]|uniref:Flagellar hook-length control protein FliK n=1 Tax=Salinisphaera aquimarina TaxID=2094031 RepID=A0ABV7ERM5_9GAMM
MGTITPILDTLLPQVLGRRGDIERFSATRPNSPLSAIASVAAVRETPGRGEAGIRESALAAGLSRSARAPAADDGSARRADVRPAATQASGARLAAGPAQTLSPAPSAHAHLSRAGATIATLLGRLAQTSAPPAPIRAPLLGPASTPSPATLALILSQQVSHSGVFYESHLLQWLEGRRPINQLREEPQAQLTRSETTAAAAARAVVSAVDSGDADGGRPSGQGHHTLSTLVDDRLLALVRQQLDTLNQSIFRWQGQAWPDVSLDWQIEHEESGESEPAPVPEDVAARYSTSLRLELPHLGTVEVRLALAARQVQVFAWAERPEGAAMLGADTATLVDRLERAGCGQASVRLIRDPEGAAE